MRLVLNPGGERIPRGLAGVFEKLPVAGETRFEAFDLFVGM
jgi:hypothetical protein